MRYKLLACGFRLWVLGIRIDIVRGCLNTMGGICLRLKRPLSSKPIVAMNRRLGALFALFRADERRFKQLEEQIVNERRQQ